MGVFKCKMCGGSIEVSDNTKIVTCEFCGTTQTVYSYDNEKKINYFNRANELRFNCEFDKASGIYETIITEFPFEAEAYWGLVLCKYGIEYVNDPYTQKKMPTCHRTVYGSIFDDNDYKKTIQNADVISKSIYESEAKAIDEIQKSIISISSKEKPYDIFICYKETDSKGQRTLDSLLSQKIYFELKNEGYNVFFARITLEDKIGIEYEPYIFAALQSSKVMIHVTTSAMNTEGVWVRNEWSRFIELIKKDRSKVLIPCYKDILPSSLPKEMQALQCQDLNKVGAMEDLIRGINKIFKKESAAVAKVKTNNDVYESYLRKGKTYLKNGAFEDAERCFKNAADIEEKCGEAYFGLLLVNYKAKNENDLFKKGSSKNIKKASEFNLAKDFSTPEFNKYLDEFLKKIEEKEIEEKYQEAKENIVTNNFNDIKNAIRILEEIGNYKDSQTLLNSCYKLLGDSEKELITDVAYLRRKDSALFYYNKMTENRDKAINDLETHIEEVVRKNELMFINRVTINLDKLDEIYENDPFMFINLINNKANIFKQNQKAVNNETIKSAYFKNRKECSEYLSTKFDSMISNFSIKQLSMLKEKFRQVNDFPLVEVFIEKIKERNNTLKEIEKNKKKKKIINFGLLIIGSIWTIVCSVCLSVFASNLQVYLTKVNKYNEANSYLNSGHYKKAKDIYEGLTDYKDSNKKAELCQSLIKLEDYCDEEISNGVLNVLNNIRIQHKIVITSVFSDYLNGDFVGKESFKFSKSPFYFVEKQFLGYESPAFENFDFKYYLNENSITLNLDRIYKFKNYRINYNLNGGTNNDKNKSYYTIGEEVILYDAYREGYTFLNWTLTGTSDVCEKIYKGSTGKKSFDANWNDGNKYSVILNPNGGTIKEKSVIVQFGAPYSFEKPIKTNFTFLCWQVSSTNIKIKNEGDWHYAADCELVAVWEYDVFDIIYDLGGGINNDKNPHFYNSNENTTLYEPIREGYVFVGRLLNGAKIEIIEKGTRGAITLNAQWKAIKNLLIVKSDNENFGSCKIIKGTGFTGETITVEASINSGYVFLGWYNNDNLVSSDLIYTFTMPSYDYEILGRFVNLGYPAKRIEATDELEFGAYPQEYVSDVDLIKQLDFIKTEYDDFFYYKGNYYVKYKAAPSDIERFFNDGSTIVNNKDYYFKCNPIKWEILEETENSIVLISSYLIDYVIFNDFKDKMIIDGETIHPYQFKFSKLREWLNEKFINNAFKGESLRFLEPVFFSTLEDKVTILNKDKFGWYRKDFVLKSINTDYTIAKGALSANYWLDYHSTSYGENITSMIDSSGLRNYNRDVTSLTSVRPCIQVSKTVLE